MTLILGLESSCDETAAALVQDGRTVLAEAIASQAVDFAAWGGECRNSLLADTSLLCPV